MCSFVHKKNDLLMINANCHLVCPLFLLCILIRLFQNMCSFVHKKNVLLTINANCHLVCPLFLLCILIRLCNITKPIIWPLTLQSI